MDEMLEFYRSIQDRLVAEHNGEFVLIQDSEVLGFYPSLPEAYWTAVEDLELEPGNFLVRLCQPREEEEPITFYSRVR